MSNTSNPSFFKNFPKLNIDPTVSIKSAKHSSSSFPSDLSEFTILNLIAESRFQVYLIQCKKTKESYVLKVFPYDEDDQPHKLFSNEAKCVYLDHEHIIDIKTANITQEMPFECGGLKISYIIQEYAPYGDLFELATSGASLNEKLVRTWFHHLVAGLSYLHNNNIAHLDIKLENLLLGKDCRLKIADFDLSRPADRPSQEASGSPIYRSPEAKAKNIKDLKAADIYSAGIVLFTLKNFGHFPHLEENSPEDSVGLYNKLYNDPEAFWDLHKKYSQQSSDFFEDDFRSLFTSMVNINPEKRPTLEEIQKSSWYGKEIYSLSELQAEVNQLYS